jgi:hypothetical protein
MQTEYYSIPFTKVQLHTMMDLLSHHGENTIVNDVRVFLNEEYNLDYIPYFEEDESQ